MMPLAPQEQFFGETAGWERPNWFADNDQVPQYEYSYGKQTGTRICVLNVTPCETL